eukprot:scaffold188382_cov21-Prasinocladus_malaysianus.AAC.1
MSTAKAKAVTNKYYPVRSIGRLSLIRFAFTSNYISGDNVWVDRRHTDESSDTYEGRIDMRARMP